MCKSSSKGMQPKYQRDGYWYKIDLEGGEALSEHICSCFMYACGVEKYVFYELGNSDSVCVSKSFYGKGESFLTLDVLAARRLSKKDYNKFYKSLKSSIPFLDKIKILADFFVSLGAGSEVKGDLEVMFYLDALLLNSDRHANNFGLIMSKNGFVRLNPVFDMGYSLGVGLFENIRGKDILPVSKKLGRGVSFDLFGANSGSIYKNLDGVLNLSFSVTEFLERLSPLVIGSIPFRIFKKRVSILLGGAKSEYFLEEIKKWEKRYE